MEARARETFLGRPAFESYRNGHLDACLKQTTGATSNEERILRVRAFTRKGSYREALDAIASVERATPEERGLLLALKSTCHSFRDELALARSALAEVRDREYGAETQFELAYARMLIAWVESNPDGMDAALNGLDVSSSPDLYGRWLCARSWVASLRGEYFEQLRLLERAIVHIAETPAARDVSLLASTVRALAHLVREIYASDTFAFTVRMVESLPWTENLGTERFLTFRGLAWAYALRGLHEKAFQYIYLARDIAPSAMWVTACYADQAYLARMAGEDRSADALLDHAVACARETDWRSQGEERVALLNLVELAADRDPVTARDVLTIYDAISVKMAPGLALAQDRRLFAMEEYARGTFLAASGDRTGALERLMRAYSIFCSIGYAWRAAASALRLHSVTQEDAWLDRASEAVRDFPDSSVAGEIRKKAAGSRDARVAALTPAQRRVFSLLCDGLTDKEVAQVLSISPETAKNHAARVRAAFGVHSRAALIASVHATSGKAV